MSDELTQPSDVATEEQKKTDTGTISKGPTGYGAVAPETKKAETTTTSKGSDGSFGATG